MTPLTPTIYLQSAPCSHSLAPFWFQHWSLTQQFLCEYNIVRSIFLITVGYVSMWYDKVIKTILICNKWFHSVKCMHLSCLLFSIWNRVCTQSDLWVTGTVLVPRTSLKQPFKSIHSTSLLDPVRGRAGVNPIVIRRRWGYDLDCSPETRSHEEIYTHIDINGTWTVRVELFYLFPIPWAFYLSDKRHWGCTEECETEKIQHL